MKNTPSETLELAPHDAAPKGAQIERTSASPIAILEKAINSGVTAENVAVVKELIQMVREQRAEEAKAAFARAFYQLKKSMPELYADKEAKDRSGNVTFRYCSEDELSKILNPHLLAHGFTDLFGQEQTDGRVIVKYTLMHEAGHSETREFSVRAGSPNAMKDAAMCDTGAATTAWRHLVMKLYGLKSRITDGQDPHVEGAFIGVDKRQYLKEQIAELGGESVNAWFWETAGVGSGQYERITDGSYPILSKLIEKKKKSKGVA